MNNKVSVIVFDLGNVLIPFDYSGMVRKLEKISPGLGQAFIHKYKDNYHIHRDFEKGILSESEFISIMLGWLDSKLSALEFCKYYSDIFTVNEDVASLLPLLRKNYRLVLLSNTNPIHKEYGWKKYNFLKYFDKLVLSHEVMAVKPEEEIYKAVEQFTGLKPESHLFIDDINEYAEAAKSFGWDAITFVNYNDLVAKLKEKKIT